MSKEKRAKKPLSKATKSLNEQLQRKRGIRDLAKRFLIVCEDQKSAPNYFNALKKHLNLSATSVVVAGSGGHSQPIQVVDRAVEMKRNAAGEDSGTEPFDEVWCVIDGDYGNKITNARTRATANDVKLAVSTKCFEYWVLLHFEENDTPTIKCDEVISSLKAKKHIPKYDKGSCDFHYVVPLVHDACKRAKKLRRPVEKPEDQNPCSEVYLLINAILGTGPRVSS